MADVIRLSKSSFHCSSLLTSSASTFNSRQSVLSPNFNLDKKTCNLSPSSVARVSLTSKKQLLSFKVHATMTETSQPKWWERNAGPNMIDIHSTQKKLNALNEAGDRLVIVEFYGTWCDSRRALFPKLCKTAEGRPGNFVPQSQF